MLQRVRSVVGSFDLTFESRDSTYAILAILGVK
jgi:hypothetical protein